MFTTKTVEVHLPKPHPKQEAFVTTTAKRVGVKAGRRGGKTVGVGIRSVNRFLAGRRQLYCTPTADQLDRWWAVVTRALDQPVRSGVFVKNETDHSIELKGTEQRIRGKTAWNADTLRGDYADDLIFDEWQLMDENAWNEVGAPMLLDNDGDAIFIYTPPSLHSRSISKARDPQHAAKMFKKFQQLEAAGNKRYATFSFSSHDNPHISRAALDEITGDMTSLAYRQEILAEDVDEAPGALWTRDTIERYRILPIEAHYDRIVIPIDPSVSSTGDEAGIVPCGSIGKEYFVLDDRSVQGSPSTWAGRAIDLYHELNANAIVAEANNGGEMVETVIKQIDPTVIVKLVHASRGKATRAEPVAALAEHGRVHHVGSFPKLEDELCLWIPGDASPNRLDAMVWGITWLSGSKEVAWAF